MEPSVLSKVAKSVQHDWTKLARAMKPWPFYRNELVNFDDDTDNSNSGKAHRMLQKWRDEYKNQNQATTSNLKRSLNAANFAVPILDSPSSLETGKCCYVDMRCIVELTNELKLLVTDLVRIGLASFQRVGLC